MEAEFEFKRLISKKGFYARIRLDVKPVTENSISVRFDTSSPWYFALCFAASYFKEHYSKIHKGGIEITILELDTQIVDSSSMVVFFVMVIALFKAFGIVHNVTIDDNGNFVIPK